MKLMDMLSGIMAGPHGHQIGQQFGLNAQQTQAAMTAAVPLLVNALAHSAQQPEGAHVLSGALAGHNGEALDRLAQGALPEPGDGQKILGHVFGPQAAHAVGRAAGINPQVAMQLLQLRAPLVFAARSRRMEASALPGVGTVGAGLGLPGQGRGLPFDPSALGGVLGQERAQMQNQLPGLFGMLGTLVDRNRDGNPFDDLLGMLGGQR